MQMSLLTVETDTMDQPCLEQNSPYRKQLFETQCALGKYFSGGEDENPASM